MSSLITEINRLISKGMYVFLFDVLNGCLVLIKEINRLKSKGMYVLLFDIFNRCFLVQLKK